MFKKWLFVSSRSWLKVRQHPAMVYPLPTEAISRKSSAHASLYYGPYGTGLILCGPFIVRPADCKTRKHVTSSWHLDCPQQTLRGFTFGKSTLLTLSALSFGLSTAEARSRSLRVCPSSQSQPLKISLSQQPTCQLVFHPTAVANAHPGIHQ